MDNNLKRQLMAELDSDEFKVYGTECDGILFCINESKLNSEYIKQIRRYLEAKEKALKSTTRKNSKK